jgi:hypothetical protein
MPKSNHKISISLYLRTTRGLLKDVEERVVMVYMSDLDAKDLALDPGSGRSDLTYYAL